MCQADLRKAGFRRLLKRHKVRFHRVKSNRRAYNKWQRKTDFFIKYSVEFDTFVDFDKIKKTFTYRYMKIEEGEELKEKLIFVPVRFLIELDHLPGSSA
jgi:hypothetical protein